MSMTVADICQVWCRRSCVSDEVPSTHTITRQFRMGDRTSEVVGHALLKFQPYLQRWANRNYPGCPDECEVAYIEFVIAIVKHPYLFSTGIDRFTLRSFIFRSYRRKLQDVLKKQGSWRERARRAGSHFLTFCHVHKSDEERARERCAMISHRVFVAGLDADRALAMGVTDGDRATWKAYWDDGLTEAEIAARRNCSVNAISARIQKVKAYLRQQTAERLSA